MKIMPLSSFLTTVLALNVITFGQNLPDILPEKQPEKTLQLLRVYVSSFEISNATVVGYARDNADQPWHIELEGMPAKIGRNGVAPVGEKREKDGHSPQGEFALGFLFGPDAEAPEGIRLAYRQVTQNDYWIDEGEDPRYNKWYSGEKPDVSHESLILNDQRYDLCLTTMYNEHPTTASKGSAIFLHIWKEPGYKTSGCVALSRENVLKILHWFDPSKEPRIRIELGEAPQK